MVWQPRISLGNIVGPGWFLVALGLRIPSVIEQGTVKILIYWEASPGYIDSGFLDPSPDS